jgi:hypothetical protein
VDLMAGAAVRDTNPRRYDDIAGKLTAGYREGSEPPGSDRFRAFVAAISRLSVRG